MQATFETKVRDTSLYPLFDAIAELYSRAERHLHVDRYARGRRLKDLKREYIVRFGITARQFNAVAVMLEGKVKAAREWLRLRADSLRGRIRATEETIAALTDRLQKVPPGDGAKQRLRFALHQKKRRLGLLRDRLTALEREMGRLVPGVCFGGRRLFHAQFDRKENGYASHEDWLADWRSARASQFLCLGQVNPAYTSVIGQIKFSSGYGLSSHTAAAVAIARRGLRFGERLRTRSRSALPLPARNRGRHVWSEWRRVSRRLRAQARGRRPSKGGRGRGIPLSAAAPVVKPGHGPPRDGLAPAPGCDSPAQTVGKAVRPAS